ncbi:MULTISPECIES: hypothetical protein [Shewanella]|uniref:hypothetical protein n=1 Tax=Shewanella TaxID=22 RepID=UPI003007C90C
MRYLFISLMLVSGVVKAEPSPVGDVAIIDLSMASMACAAVQKVNPQAVDKIESFYLSDSIKLYQLYHDFSYEVSERNIGGLYNIIIGEPAVKAQSLHSITGAKNYLLSYLQKTDAKNCSEIRKYSNQILSKYYNKLL